MINDTRTAEQIRKSDLVRCQEDMGYNVLSKTWEQMSVTERKQATALWDAMVSVDA